MEIERIIEKRTGKELVVICNIETDKVAVLEKDCQANFNNPNFNDPNFDLETVFFLLDSENRVYDIAEISKFEKSDYEISESESDIRMCFENENNESFYIYHLDRLRHVSPEELI